MFPIIDKQPKGVTETTALLKASSMSSISSSIHSVSSLSELSILSPIATFRINRHNKSFCCNFSRDYEVRDGEKNDLLFTAYQENGLCSCANDDYEDMMIFDLNDQLMFSIEFEERAGYLSKQMKFSIVSSDKRGLGTVSKIWHFMETPRYEIISWSGELLFSIGPPATSGIRSYNYQLKYDVLSIDGRIVANILQEHVGRTVAIRFDKVDVLSLRDKTLILALGFILDLLRNDES